MNILFLVPLRYAAALPFVVASIHKWVERSHNVTIVASDGLTPELSVGSDRATMRRFRDSGLPRGIRYWTFASKAWQVSGTEHYDLIVGLSPLGLIAAAWIARRLGCPYVYYNDEISFGNERGTYLGNLLGHGVKALERWACRKAMFTVTQDPLRGRYVAETNRVSIGSLRYLPNSRAGAASIRQSYFLHDRLGFAHSDKAILWMGHAGPGGGALELAREATLWPRGWRMVFHLRADPKNPYIRELLACHGRGAVHVSTQMMLSYEDTDELAASATIGLGFYADEGINVRCMGFSSGRINHLLKNGIPCIVRDFEGLRWVEDHGAGLCVPSTAGVFNAAKEILSAYADYRARAALAFDRLLGFDKAFEGIVTETEHALETAGKRRPGRIPVVQ